MASRSTFDVAVLLRKALAERLPLIAAGAAAEDLQLAVDGKMLRVALDGHDVDGLGLMGVDVDDEAEVGGQVAADLGQLSPALSERITSQCFCMKSTSGRAGCMAT